MPWSAQTILHEVHLTDGATVKTVENKRRLLCFGDSITQGYLSRFTSLSYVNQTARALEAEVINQGIGGWIFNHTTIDESILCYQPDVITVAYGTNDYSRYDRAEDFAREAEKYITKLGSLYPDTPILGILPIYRNDQNHQIRSLYRDYSLDDARAILQGYYEALPNGSVLAQTGIPHISQAYAQDYLHPNEFGFTLMAQGIIRKLQQMGL